MSEEQQTAGRTTIAPGVLLTMTRLSALSVDGVSRMANAPRVVSSLLRKNTQQENGILLRVEDNTVYLDLYVVLKCDVSIREVSHTIQGEVARTISELVGMNVGGVNVHIEDIDYPESADS